MDSPNTPEKPKDTPDKKAEYLSLSALKNDHGFSARLIDELLGEPDKLAKNPRFRSASPMKLFDEKRVLRAKESPAWKAYQQTRARRSAAASKVQDAKREATRKWAATVKIRWIDPPRSAKEAIREGIEHWEFMQAERYENYGASGHNAERADHVRWAVNYLRHACLEYEETLDDAHGRTGRAETALPIKLRCLRMIAKRYPAFGGECKRQAEEAQAPEYDY